jgi:alpha-mannosidase
LYKDVPGDFDAWDIDSMYESTPVELTDKASFTVVVNGPLAAILRIKRKLHDSTLTQDVVLRSDSRRVDFRTTIDWQERHKLLKVNFPVAVNSHEALHEIQFGHLARPNHKSRQFDADRFEVCNHKWTALVEANQGCAVLNDCKYGVSVNENSINLTLLRAPLAPDMRADLGLQEFTYAFYSWNGPFASCDLVRQAYELNCPVLVVPGNAGEKSFFRPDAENIVLETVKPAEDASGDIILRLYEAKHAATRCALQTALPVKSAQLTDMLERPLSNCAMEKGALALEFRPFEIKTIRLKIGK